MKLLCIPTQYPQYPYIYIYIYVWDKPNILHKEKNRKKREIAEMFLIKKFDNNINLCYFNIITNIIIQLTFVRDRYLTG